MQSESAVEPNNQPIVEKQKRTRKPKLVVDLPVQQPVVVVKEKRVKKEKKKRNIDPEKMTYIKAFGIYKKDTGYKGLSPKKDTDEYQVIMKIMRGEK